MAQVRHTTATTTSSTSLKGRTSWRAARALLRRLTRKPSDGFGRSRHEESSTEGVTKDGGTDKGGDSITTTSWEKSVLEPDTPDGRRDGDDEHAALPNVQKALVVARKGEYEIRHDFPMPVVAEDEIMIRSHYVGMNPIDWKSVDYNFCLPQFPWVTGREMSGVVAQVGSAVSAFLPGDRVWTSTYYKDVRAGCFQDYVVVPSHTVLAIPSTVSFEQAACLGVAALTAGMTLWKWLAVPTPSTTDGAEQGWVLIWGGSTATGQFATQLAVHSHLKVITVNSAETRELSRKLGASHVVVRDGKSDQELVEEIRSVTAGTITRAIDLVGPESAALALRAVSREQAVAFAPLAMMSSSQLVPDNVTVHTVEMKQFILDKTNVAYAHELRGLLESGKVLVPALHLLSGGLEVVEEGLEVLKKGNMKGKKLVVQVR